MAKAKKLQENGVDIIPVTHESIVFDDNGLSIPEKYQTLDDAIVAYEFDGSIDEIGNVIKSKKIVNTSEEFINAISSGIYTNIILNPGEYIIDEEIDINNIVVEGIGFPYDKNSPRVSMFVKTPIQLTGSVIKNIYFYGDNSNDCINMKGGCKIDECLFYTFDTIIKQSGICVHGYIKNCIFAYSNNGIKLDCVDDYSMNNFIIENNYFVKIGINADDFYANSTINDGIGIALYLAGGCNNVVVKENCFEYNTCCGVYLSNNNPSKTNDSVIINNYFEGNKSTGIIVENNNGPKSCQYKINNNFFSPVKIKNEDNINDDVVFRGIPSSYYPVINKNNKSMIYGDVNVVYNEKENFIEITNASQYIQIFGNKVTVDKKCMAVVHYTAHLTNGNITINNTAPTSAMFTISADTTEGAVICEFWGASKYLSRQLVEGEYIRINKIDLL